MKPYSKSIINKFKAENSPDARHYSSLWNTNKYCGETWRKAAERILAVAKYKQSDMTKLEDGDTELVIMALSSPEVGFMQIDKSKLIGLKRLLFPNPEGLINFVTEFGRERAYEIQNADYAYFNDLVREYDYVVQLDNVKTLQGKKYLLARRGQDLSELIADNPESVIVVLSIEGGHTLLPFASDAVIEQYTPHVDDLNHPLTTYLLSEISKNIQRIKSWEHGSHCPLYLTLSHHFWNLLAGHAPSLPGFLNQILDQTRQVNRGMTELGKKVVEQLLSQQNGPRILIDTKHMSYQARDWYLKFIAAYNQDNPGDTIPIISSHSAANGFKKLSESWLSEVYYEKGVTHIIANEKYESSEKFNNWSINVSDEEALSIFASGGLIGLSLDQRILAGRTHLTKAQKDQSKTAWAALFYNQIAHFYHLFYQAGRGDAKRAIGTLCIGSDFDGIINPLNHFGTSRDFNFLKQELYGLILNAKLDARNPFRFPEISVEEVVEGVMYNSAKNFVEKWFKNYGPTA